MTDPKLQLGVLETPAEAEICARMMAESEPWRTLRRDYGQCLARVCDETKESDSWPGAARSSRVS
ncbi:MAG: hypothetical protein ABJC07_07475 [Acidobacteriota bacterium]